MSDGTGQPEVTHLVIAGYETDAGDELIPENPHNAYILVCGTASDMQAATEQYGDKEWVYLVDGTSDVWGTVGDLFGPIARAGDMLTDTVGPHKPVAITIRLGLDDVTFNNVDRVRCVLTGGGDVAAALGVASGLADCPSEGGAGLLPRVRATASLVLAAFRSTLTADSAIPQREFRTLTRRESTGVVPTTLLRVLLESDAVMLSGGHESACADLLERAGYPNHASSLRGLVDHWVHQRLWRVNYVPEMVLHNSIHSAAVDRNVASLCEPFLRTRTQEVHSDCTQPLTEQDVMILAVAAWLHDWGQASVTYAGRFAVDPVDVRNYHGAFTARLLQGTYSGIHRVDTVGRKLGIDKLMEHVGLLSRHHQGWTSCNAENPPPNRFKPPRDQERLLVSQPIGWEDKEHTGPIVRAYDSDFYHLEGHQFEPRDGGLYHEQRQRLRKAHWLLAVIRLADALDIGIHRIPNYSTQHHDRLQVLEDYLDRCAERTGLIAGGASVALFMNGINPVEKLRNGFNKVRVTGGRLGDVTEEKLTQDFSDQIGEEFELDFTPKKSERLSDSDKKRYYTLSKDLQNTAKYVEHILHQITYYEEQYRVRALLPVPEKHSSGYKLSLHVVPNGSQDECELTVQLQAFAMREWGQEVQRPGRDPEPGDSTKQDILTYLNDLGFAIDRSATVLCGTAATLKDLPVVSHPPMAMTPVPPGPARPPAMPGVAALTSIPDGWAGWTAADNLLASREAPLDRGVLATTADRQQIVTIDSDGTVRTSHDIPGRDLTCALRGHHTDMRLIGVAGTSDAPNLVLAATGELLLCRWQRGDWSIPQAFACDEACEIQRAFVWPDGGAIEESLIVVYRDGTVRQGIPPRRLTIGLPPRVRSLDVLAMGQSYWWAWVDPRQNQVRVESEPHFGLAAWDQDLPGAVISDVWLAAPDGNTVTVYARSDVGDIARRVIDVPSGGWKA